MKRKLSIATISLFMLVGLCIIVGIKPYYTRKFIIIMEIFVSIGLTFLFVAWCLIKRIETRVHEKISNQIKLFNIDSPVRNVDVLVIGVPFEITNDIGKEKKKIEFICPERTLEASFQILKHTHSLLRGEKSTVILSSKQQDKYEMFNIFDVPFLHTITIQKFNLQKLKKRYIHPFIYDPILTIRFLRNKSTKGKIQKCPDKEINEFCKKRGYRLIYFQCE